MSNLMKLKTEQGKREILEHLFSWDLETTNEAMNTFRTHTADNFPYMEGIMDESMKELTLRFSGSDKQASIALNFSLIPSNNM